MIYTVGEADKVVGMVHRGIWSGEGVVCEQSKSTIDDIALLRTNVYVEERNTISWTWQNPISSSNRHQAVSVLFALLSLRSTFAA